MQVKWYYNRFRNQTNLDILDRLLRRGFLSIPNLAASLTEATAMPIFLAHRMLQERLELTEKDIEYRKDLEQFYGALVLEDEHGEEK